MKQQRKTIIMAGVLAASLATAVGAQAKDQPNLSPFTDNLTVQLVNFSQAVNVAYTSDNGVTIGGPGSVAAATPSVPVVVASTNQIENGFPSMAVTLADGSRCQLKFVDGPYTYLNYQTQAAPTCAHIQVSSISNPGQYQYGVTLTYHA